MIEIYLFVNPIGKLCLQAEQDILALVEKEHKDKSIQFRFIPLLNLRTINGLIQQLQIPRNDLEQRNRLFETIYSAALDYKAVQLQGKKKGRAFLLALQAQVDRKGTNYTPELVERLVKETGADWEMFQSDRASEFVRESFQADQQIAREMGITKHPSAVIYNYACERDYGVLLEDYHTIEELAVLCETTEETYHTFHDDTPLSAANERRVAHRHLRLV
ncbi:dithiol-disulfide isomerase [Enterococcus canis]|uniref:Dithiol-disulfide isomerase n=1 Tax=Enterococcus canis TaxID=214095 RepID=A0A1L8RGI0_9ENTE|nr:DsbA family protein [Enterococcus canis]OJG18879.1 dithiol-disulfide isomerase [Enterococcus canis]